MRQEISALMDGELDGKAAGRLISALKRDREAIEAWRVYHLIGDALRESPPLAEGFGAKLARQLAQEPTIVARSRLQPQPRTWYALAASVAAVALVGWLGFAPQHAPAPVATAPQPVRAAKPASVPLPSGTNDYLFAHQGFSPRMSLQGMAPYVRTVSEQGREPRR